MARYTRLCPSCGAEIDRKTVPVLKAHSFSCPFCGAPPRVTTDHVGVALVISPILSAALTLLLGFRGLIFALITIIGSGLIFLTLAFIEGLVRPARLELRPPTDLSLRLPKEQLSQRGTISVAPAFAFYDTAQVRTYRNR